MHKKTFHSRTNIWNSIKLTESSFTKNFTSLVKLPSQIASSCLGGYIVPRLFSTKRRQIWNREGKKKTGWESLKVGRDRHRSSRSGRSSGRWHIWNQLPQPAPGAEQSTAHPECWKLQNIKHFTLELVQTMLGLTPLLEQKLQKLRADKECRTSLAAVNLAGWSHVRALGK